MIKLLVVGTVAYDSIETPFGKVENVLGGSALHFTSAASFFTDVGIIASVGKDFDLEDISYLKDAKRGHERHSGRRGEDVPVGREIRFRSQPGDYPEDGA